MISKTIKNTVGGESLAPALRAARNFRQLALIGTRTTHYVRGLRKKEKEIGRIETALAQRSIVAWGLEMMKVLKLDVSTKGEPTKEPALFVGNHISYMDIPLLMSLAPVVFVAKKQIASWPFFGAACRSVGGIFVDRDSKSSRQNASAMIPPVIQDRGISVVIFPSGTTTMDESKPWKRGVFKIAHENKIPLQPFRIRYQPARLAAYLQEDNFLAHLWGVLGSDGLKVTVEFHPPVYVHDPDLECEKFWNWSREGLVSNEVRADSV